MAGAERERLLITGGRGFVGRHLLQTLCEAGPAYDIHAVSSTADVDAALSSLPVTWHAIDLSTPGRPAELVAELRPRLMVHAAWTTAHGTYWHSLDNLSWLAVTCELVRAFGEAGGRRFVQVGTCAEYDWSDGTLTEDVTAEVPATLYGRCKLAAHQVLQAAAERHDFSAATGRIFFAYGPFENAGRLIPSVCRHLAAGRPARTASGTQLRDFMHVTDVARGFAALLASDLTGAVNVACGTATRLSAITGRLGEIAGRSDLVEIGALADRPDDPPLLVGDSRKLRATGWAPRVGLDEGLTATFAWWRDRGDAAG